MMDHPDVVTRGIRKAEGLPDSRWRALEHANGRHRLTRDEWVGWGHTVDQRDPHVVTSTWAGSTRRHEAPENASETVVPSSRHVSRRISQASRVVSRWFRRFRSDFAANFTVVSQDFTVISQGFTCASHVKCVK